LQVNLELQNKPEQNGHPGCGLSPASVPRPAEQS
jgi:hypothetical protein